MDLCCLAKADTVSRLLFIHVRYLILPHHSAHVRLLLKRVLPCRCWLQNPHNLEDRNSLAKLLFTADCKARPQRHRARSFCQLNVALQEGLRMSDVRQHFEALGRLKFQYCLPLSILTLSSQRSQFAQTDSLPKPFSPSPNLHQRAISCLCDMRGDCHQSSHRWKKLDAGSLVDCWLSCDDEHMEILSSPSSETMSRACCGMAQSRLGSLCVCT